MSNDIAEVRRQAFAALAALNLGLFVEALKIRAFNAADGYLDDWFYYSQLSELDEPPSTGSVL